MQQISNLPPKGTYDWLPEEFSVRKYIFDTWRKVCLQFGYEEYLTPILEYSEVYKAKSGEDVGVKELMTMQDRAGRELAIRPEMTPSVTRMVTRIYENSPKPLRLFSIANFFRNEKPQKGRNREFWQLNADIFGSDSLMADVEVLDLAISLMQEFGATSDQFTVLLNNRKFIEDFLQNYLKVNEENRINAIRILDKFWKIPADEFVSRLEQEAGATVGNKEELIELFKGKKSVIDLLGETESAKETKKIIEVLEQKGLGEFIKFDLSLVRGFDYYDGMIFEVFDRKAVLQRDSEEAISNGGFRSLFGGGRYNGLAGIFGSKSFPAVGFAPGDETTKIFLEENNLLEGKLNLAKTYYFPVLSEELSSDVTNLAKTLRSENKIVKVGLEVQKLGKALEYSNKIKADYVIILGEEEKKVNQYLIKELATGEQKTYSL